MKCSNCGTEIADNAVFCPSCGAKQAKQPQNRPVCRSCGAPLKAGAQFCPACGAKVEAAQAAPQAPQPAPHTAQPAAEPASPPQKATKSAPQTGSTGKKPPVALLIAAGAAVVVLTVVLMRILSPQPADASDPVQAQGGAPAESGEASDTIVPEDIESSDADLLADGPVSLQGEVKISTENTLFLSWEEPISILLKQDNGEYVRVNDISSVYLENRDVDPALWDELPLPQAVEITGELSIDGTRLYLAADSLTDTDGNALVVEAAPADEILPDSDDRLLTERDISGLSLQQINYAKNEIYARHGRRFLSPELQNYFDAQPWYRGTVDADQFDESILSDIEKKNAEFLAEVEFSIEPNGYKLDA